MSSKIDRAWREGFRSATAIHEANNKRMLNLEKENDRLRQVISEGGYDGLIQENRRLEEIIANALKAAEGKQTTGFKAPRTGVCPNPRNCETLGHCGYAGTTIACQ